MSVIRILHTILDRVESIHSAVTSQEAQPSVKQVPPVNIYSDAAVEAIVRKWFKRNNVVTCHCVNDGSNDPLTFIRESELAKLKARIADLEKQLAAEYARPTVWPETLNDDFSIRLASWSGYSPSFFREIYELLIDYNGGVPRQRTHQEAWNAIEREKRPEEFYRSTALRLDAEEVAKLNPQAKGGGK